MATKTLEDATVTRTFLISAAALSAVFLPKRWTVGISMMLVSVLAGSALQIHEEFKEKP